MTKMLIVDAVRKLLGRMLEMQGYHCTLAADAAEARQCLKGENFDLILSDLNMPGESGLHLIQHVLAKYPDTAIIMVTVTDDPDVAKTALETGVYGYVIKPFEPNEVLINVENALRRRQLEIDNRLHRENLEQMVLKRTAELRESILRLKKTEKELREREERLGRTLGGVIQAMSMTVETRDPYTAGHQQRVADLAQAIATEMGLSRQQIEGIAMTGMIHDLGKMSVPSDILSKPTRLSEAEFAIIRTHPQVGYDILKAIEFPWPVAQILYQHHERMDGSGYPRGLSNDEILLEARIMAVSDVVEAMASHRPYRAALGIEAALEEISRKKGALYDPMVVNACLKLFKERDYKLSAYSFPFWKQEILVVDD
jgi:putative two-component system response regulator